MTTTMKTCQYTGCEQPGDGPYGLEFCDTHTLNYSLVRNGKQALPIPEPDGPPSYNLPPCTRGHIREDPNVTSAKKQCRACANGTAHFHRNRQIGRPYEPLDVIIERYYEEYKPPNV